MGGPVPLGYEVIDRKLIPVPEEAERVRTIMRRYIASRSANELIAELETEGIRTKVQKRTSGPHRGGIPFRRGSLFHLLKNPIYRGKIVHKGEVYEGEHEAIVDEELWNAVQQRLKEKAPPRKRPKNDPQPALLRGLLTDPEGRPMVPTYATKGTRRYAYYETRKDLARPEDPAATRIGQGQLERHLIVQLTALLEDEHALRRISGEEEGGALQDLFSKAKVTVARLAFDQSRVSIIPELIAAMQIGDERINVRLNADALGSRSGKHWNWSIPLPPRKPFREAKLRIEQEEDRASVDQKLVMLLVEAQQVRDLILTSPDLSLNQIAKREGRCRTQLRNLVRVSWLSPRIVEAIVSGKQPSHLDRRLLLEADLPACWAAQEQMLGISS
jgi:site-specific DNA recombinase